MTKFRKVYICFLLIPMLVSCTSHQEKYFLLNKVNESELSYQFEMYGLETLKIKLVEYVNNEIVNIIPLGWITYHKITSDQGTIDFKYALSEVNQKVITLRLNSQHFKHYGDMKILNSDIDLSSYNVNFLASKLQIDNNEENVELLEFTQSNHSKNKFVIKLDISILN